MITQQAIRLMTLVSDPNAKHDAVRDAAFRFTSAAQDADPREIAKALEIVSGAYALEATENTRFALIAAGSLLEDGVDAAPLVEPALRFLGRIAPAAVEFHKQCLDLLPADTEDEAEAFETIVANQRTEQPETARAWDALEANYVHLIAVLAGSPKGRAAGRAGFIGTR